MRTSRFACFLILLATFTTVFYAADITGKWTGKNDYGSDWAFNFKLEGNKLTGTMMSAEGKDLPLNDGKLDGDALSFSVDSEWQGQPIKLVMTGKVAGEQIQLRIETADGSWGTDTVLKRAS